MTTQRLYSTNYDYIKYENIIKKIKFITKIHPLKLGLSIQLLGCISFSSYSRVVFNKLNIVNANQLLFKL